ncbi:MULTISPECIES: TonB-dependent receptor plug domain-containing protein [Bradyrhizobium]|uniref:TonB-dependent receptor n=2 Tax=Bradyrhizobium TaxID=374 RepID=A0ABS5G7M1_9BRAD|nr:MULTISPECIES: TonB-dependent receptor [Bradyrhizobium]MBR1137286.1 TonB-dependent receptor [Bradyrhizobium denitrificans]MDU1491440.1 TonB-dependent receptor [Bradyrhizobium sp.]MDU1541618.1 TonB-dependent receptor [Bradyrhizobium sp.]MDU1802100.1 TonB-dependent receptor [Bradyrhizobium sp.]MDU2927456.1 TonB-dependent receptor [Bradyrhizobium sp.]
MFSFLSVARRHRAGLSSSTVLVSIATFGAAPATAQQSASPDLLPPVEVDPPRKPAAPKPALPRGAQTPRARASQPAATQSAAAQANAQLVVSPTGIATPAAHVANAITVVTAKDIATQQFRSVPDILAAIPGLNVVQTGGAGGQSSVFTRGTNANHTKILIDGIDVGDVTNANGAFDFAHLLTSDIQQFEVLRGPQSGLYGSDAIGGVISVITRKGDGPARATASIETGTYQTFNQSAGVSGSQDNVNYAMNVAHLHAGDIPVTPQQLLPAGQKAIGNAYDNVTASTKFGVDLNEAWSLNSVMRYTDATLLFTGDGSFPSVPNAAQSTHAVRQFATREEAVWSLLDGRIKNYFGINYVNNRTSDLTAGNPLAAISTGERIKYDWHAVTELAPHNNFIVGLEQQTDRLQTTGLTAENGNRAGFVEVQTNFAQRMFLVASLRNDINDQFGSHGTYRIAPAVILPVTETKLKASYGTGFKAPTLSQLYQDFPAFNFFANPNLKPEQSTGYDAGFEQPLFDDRIRLGATYFHNSITDLINSNVTFTSYANVGLATTEGTESFVTAHLTDRLSLRADYTFTRAVDATTGLQLLRRPKEKWSATAVWTPLDPLTVSATLLRVSDWRDVSRDGMTSGLVAPGYTVVNLRADYAVSGQVKLFGRVDNLFNRHYQNPTGFLAPGLGVFGGIRMASFGME